MSRRLRAVARAWLRAVLRPGEAAVGRAVAGASARLVR